MKLAQPRDRGPPMRDITSPTWLYVKGGLFLVCGLLASVLLLVESPTLQTAVLLGIVVWSFCRLYYFAFYVIEHYSRPGLQVRGADGLRPVHPAAAAWYNAPGCSCGGRVTWWLRSRIKARSPR